jgi:hypothetical protein
VDGVTVSLLLDLRWEHDQPVGTVALRDGAAAPLAFRGWLELAAAVEALTPRGAS